MKNAMAAGVKSPNTKAPDKKGAFIDVQRRTLSTAKCGKKVTKK
jgi:hypothetical protein